MKYTYVEHRSSIGYSANLISMMAYVYPLAIYVSVAVFRLPSFFAISSLVFLVGLFILEKDSPLVKYHTVQSFEINILIPLLYNLLIWLMSLTPFASSIGMEYLFIGLSTLTLLLVFTLPLYTTYKAFEWSLCKLPIISDLAVKISRGEHFHTDLLDY